MEVLRDAGQGERVEQLVALGRALSDPIRVKMLGVLAAGRGCGDLSEVRVPVNSDEAPGICVCEFMEYYGMGQSKVSYHLGKLKEAGLVQEEKRGKWSFYSLDRTSAAYLISNASDWLGVGVAGGEDD
ncbi:MAG: ArsR/SmtB family transcription factor [Rubrobacteraceae bacterium]